MKKLSLIIFLLLIASMVSAQKRPIDSLIAKLNQLDFVYNTGNGLMQRILAMPRGDFELLKNERQNLVKAESTGNTLKQLFALRIIDELDFYKGDLPGVLNIDLKGIRLSRESRNNLYLGSFLQKAGLIYALTGDDKKSLDYARQALAAAIIGRDTLLTIDILSNIETSYTKLKKPDSALFYARRELRLFTNYTKPNRQVIEGEVMGDMAEAMNTANQPDSSLKYSRKALLLEMGQSRRLNPELLNIISNSFLKKGQPDSALKFALQSYKLLLPEKRWDLLADACAALSKSYENRDDKKSLFYLKALIASSDSSRLNVNAAKFQLLADRDKQYDQDLRDAREKLNVRIRLYLAVGAAFAMMIIGIILWYNFKRQKMNNRLLSEQKKEIETQRDEIGKALYELKITQTQLIQSEKMASLGELTAGIAHEIQNPLNFVNNFSEVNKELLTELKQELAAQNYEEVSAIADDVIGNEEKINHHGKRADAIVRGMLQHSQSGSGTKELTNINALADEYIRLAYHGLRAKDKSFNAEIITHFDESLPKINVIPQDIGRVLLNLLNNAFYAVNQKLKTVSANYRSEVSITTTLEKNIVFIAVKDNGIGIPDAIKEKIMQPFFTTKPTGEGTGLGLSLTYDIVVKGHGGTITVNTKEGEFTEFTISLPA